VSRPADDRVGARHLQVDAVAKERADVLELVLDHRRTLEREAPRDHGHFLGEAHRAEHLRTEHARVAALDPPARVYVYVCVRVSL